MNFYAYEFRWTEFVHSTFAPVKQRGSSFSHKAVIMSPKPCRVQDWKSAIRCLEVPKSGRKFCSLCLHCILKRAWLIQSRATMKVSNIVTGNTWIIPNLLNSIIQEYLQLVDVNKPTGLPSPLSYHEWYASIMHEYQRSRDKNRPSCSSLFRFSRQQGGRFNSISNSEAYRMNSRKINQNIHKTKPLFKCCSCDVF